MEDEIFLPVYTGEDEGEGEGGGFASETDLNANKSVISDFAGKPQVWVQLRPPCTPDDNVFEIGSDEKSLRLMIEPRELNQNKFKPFENRKDEGDKGLIFKTDGILLGISQADTYRNVVNEVVEKAILKGVSGTIVALGPNQSGKSFTLFGFGNLSEFQYRGIIPRALEKVFELIESKCNQFVYLIRLGMIEVRKDRIRDLLTLGPYELQQVGETGPHGMLLQQIGCAEHGLGLLIRGLTGQKNFPRECYIRYHTIVYIDVQGEGFDENGEHQVIKSRITFAKTASMPLRTESSDKDTSCERIEEVGTTIVNTVSKPCRSVRDPLRNASNMYTKDSPMIEDIAVRRDLFFLEQMFIRANELGKMQRLYSKLRNIGMTKMMHRPKSTPSQYFRQSKLAHCLQDIVAGRTEIRIILNIRPERKFLHTALAALRFAERAKCLPHDVMPEATSEAESVEMLKNEIAFLKAELENRAHANRPISVPDSDQDQLDVNQLATIQQAANDYLGGRIDEIPIINKAQVRATFEALRQLWRDRKDTEAEDQMESSATHDKEQSDNTTKTQGSIRKKSFKSEKKYKGRKEKDQINETPEAKLDEIINSTEDKTPGEKIGSLAGSVARQQRTSTNTVGDKPDIQRAPTKAEAWNEFIATKQGHDSIEQDGNKAVLNATETDVNVLTEEQLLEADGYDDANNIIVTAEEKNILHEIKALQLSRKELLDRLRNIRMHLYSNNQDGSIRQNQFNGAFEAFCSNRYGVIYGENGIAIPVNHESSLEDDLCSPHKTTMAELMTKDKKEAGKQFDNLRRLAEEQAKEFLKLYPKRPPWAANW